MSTLIARDHIVAVFILAGSLIWRHIALEMPPSYVKNVPGPAFFPLAIAACLIVLSTILLFRKPDASKQSASAAPNNLRQAVVFALILLYVLLVPVLGFAIATALSLSAIMLHTRQLSVPATLATAAAVSLVLFVVFKLCLGIPLPDGTLF